MPANEEPPLIPLPPALEKARQWSAMLRDATVGTVMVFAMFAGKWAFDEFKSIQEKHFTTLEKIRSEDATARERVAEKFITADERRQQKLDVVVEKLADVARTLGDAARDVRRTGAKPTANGGN